MATYQQPPAPINDPQLADLAMRLKMTPGVAPDFSSYLEQQRPELFTANQQNVAPPTTPTPVPQQPDVPRGTTSSSTSMEMTSSVPTGPSSQELFAQMNARELESLKAQGLTTANLRKQLEELQGSKGLDPVALMALGLGDLFSGKDKGLNFAAGVQGGRKQDIERLQKAISAGEQNLTDDELNLLKMRLQNQQGVDTMKATEAQRKIENDFERQRLKIEADKAKQGKPFDPMAAWQMRGDIDKSKMGEQITGSIELSDALNAYEELLDTYGTNPVGVGSAALASAYSNITLAYKKSGELGALAGPDEKIVNRGVQKEGDITSWLKSSTKGGAAGAKASINQVRSGLREGFKTRMGTLRSRAAGFEPLVGDHLNQYETQFNGTLDKRSKPSVSSGGPNEWGLTVGQKDGNKIYKGGDPNQKSSWGE